MVIERDLQGALQTRKVVAHPELHSLPGWESVHKALEFLKSETRQNGILSVPLASFLESAGVVL